MSLRLHLLALFFPLSPNARKPSASAGQSISTSIARTSAFIMHSANFPSRRHHMVDQLLREPPSDHPTQCPPVGVWSLCLHCWLSTPICSIYRRDELLLCVSKVLQMAACFSLVLYCSVCFSYFLIDFCTCFVYIHFQHSPHTYTVARLGLLLTSDEVWSDSTWSVIHFFHFQVPLIDLNVWELYYPIDNTIWSIG